LADELIVNQVLNSEPLLHELQLGEQLGTCIHQKRRADFSLMLAMLTDDAREQSQFYLPKEEQKLSNKETNVTLRKRFHLPKEAPLSIEKPKLINQFNQADKLNEKHLAHIHLTNVIRPLPLAFRNDVQHIESKIMKNTSLFCQFKHTKKEGGTLNKRLPMNVEGWLNAIQTSLVKSSLVYS